MKQKRIAVTGMSVNTALGDTLDGYIENLLQGKSGISRWKSIDSERIYAKVGGDIGSYDLKRKARAYQGRIPDPMQARLMAYLQKSTFSVGATLCVALEAFVDAGCVHDITADNNIATVVAGHNLNQKYSYRNYDDFREEPDFIDGLMGLKGLDSHHVGMVTDLLQLHGPAYTIGGACASGNFALRNAIDEIRTHGAEMALVVAPILDFSELDLQGMAVMGAISIKSFNDEPERASRPYDRRREGFVPSHGAAALVLEDLDRARARGARIYAEILGVEASADGCHLPQPSRQGQARLMRRLLANCGARPENVDFICAHATSTPLGDMTEINSIKDVFGKHAYTLKINAPKSMLGHTCWSAAVVETVAAILQMNRGELHPSINIDDLDPEVDLDVCRGGRQTYNVNLMMKNSFGFGGLNSVSLIRKFNG
jgi:3-oxoacyl-(acyl-carrier-protein) synthase